MKITKKHIFLYILPTIILAFTIGAAYGYFSHRRSMSPGVDVDHSRYPVFGIDISSHNGVIDFESVAADGVEFVYAKASEGATFQDRLFPDNMRRARKAGLKVGAYHFFRFDVPGHLQALNFINAVRMRDLDLPLVIDVEEWTNPRNESTENVVARLREMTTYLESRGYKVMIYTNKDGLDRFFPLGDDGHHLWICSFTSPPLPTDDWTLWQHSHRGRVAGIDGPVDVNTYNGSRQSFQRWLSEP